MVRDRDGGVAQLGRAPDQPVDLGRPVEERVLGVAVEVAELGHRAISSGGEHGKVAGPDPDRQAVWTSRRPLATAAASGTGTALGLVLPARFSCCRVGAQPGRPPLAPPVQEGGLLDGL